MTLPDNHMDLIQATELSFDEATSTSTASYYAPQCLTSSRGFIQGGFVGGFLDHIMGLAYYKASGEQSAGLNLELAMKFLRPVHVGRIVGKGRVVKNGSRVVYLEGELYDEAGELLATATSTAIPTPAPRRG